MITLEKVLAGLKAESLNEIIGGVYHDDGCIPDWPLPGDPGPTLPDPLPNPDDDPYPYDESNPYSESIS
jgi:hypothetical protein